MRPALIVVIILYIAGVIALISYAVGHPPTGPEICNPVACQPNPNYTPPVPTPAAASSQAAPTAPPAAGPGAWWRGVNPCHLLTTSQARTLGFGAKRLVTGGNGICAWVEPAAPDVLTASTLLRLTIVLSPYPDYMLGEISRHSFRAANGRPGEIARDETTGDCLLTLQATKGPTAVIFVSGSAQDCTLATEAANFISPELPRTGLVRALR